MKPVPIPENEEARLRALENQQLLDSLPEDVYDQITRLAADICGTPVAAINLVAGDHQWTKSVYGSEGFNGPRSNSFCAHTIVDPGTPFVIEDARRDDRFSENPLVTGDPHIVFYAGVPVTDEDGYALGALCVTDSRPRELPEYKLQMLQALAGLVKTHFELRRTKQRLERAQGTLQAARDAFAPLAGEGAGVMDAATLRARLDALGAALRGEKKSMQ